MAETITASVAAGVIMLIIGALLGRLTIKTKTQEDVKGMGWGLEETRKKLDEHIEKSEERNALILDSLLAIMLTLKKGSANGEIDGALKKLNDYNIKQGSRN